MRIGEIITKYCDEHGLSYRQFALRAGVTNGYISMLVNGANPKTGRPLRPTVEAYSKLARGMGMSVNELFEIMDDAPVSLAIPTLPSSLIPVSRLHRQRVPVIGHVAAGVPIMAEQEYETFVESPVRCDAALIVDGDSMAPTYLPHDLVYIRHQPDVLDGQVGIVLIDDSATMKHVYHKPYGLLLVSDNPAYPPMDIRGDEHDYLSIFGLVVGYTRMLDQ